MAKHQYRDAGHRNQVKSPPWVPRQAAPFACCFQRAVGLVLYFPDKGKQLRRQLFGALVEISKFSPEPPFGEPPRNRLIASAILRHSHPPRSLFPSAKSLSRIVSSFHPLWSRTTKQASNSSRVEWAWPRPSWGWGLGGSTGATSAAGNHGLGRTVHCGKRSTFLESAPRPRRMSQLLRTGIARMFSHLAALLQDSDLMKITNEISTKTLMPVFNTTGCVGHLLRTPPVI
jgi:hypothetical protein